MGTTVKLDRTAMAAAAQSRKSVQNPDAEVTGRQAARLGHQLAAGIGMHVPELEAKVDTETGEIQRPTLIDQLNHYQRLWAQLVFAQAQALGHTIEFPVNRGEASELIDEFASVEPAAA